VKTISGVRGNEKRTTQLFGKGIGYYWRLRVAKLRDWRTVSRDPQKRSDYTITIIIIFL